MRSPEGVETLPVHAGAEFERQVGTMALSQLEGAGALALMRAVAWHNALARLGYAVPLVVAHEFFNPQADLRKCRELERNILQDMVTSVSHRWIVRTTDPTTYASAIIEALQRGRAKMVA